jgi:CubicO group peptidase (beta-lactamase class C family)
MMPTYDLCRQIAVVFLAAPILLHLVSCAADGRGAVAGRPRMAFPGRTWWEATPESQGLDSAKLDEAMEYVKEIAQDHADGTKSQGNDQCVVVRNGYVIWKGTDVDNKHSIYSCGKSFMSATFGLLVDEGLCTPETVAADYVPALKEHYPAVTLRQFANFTSGYNVPWREPPFEVREPLHPPGEKFHYSASSDQLAHVLTRIAGEPLRDVFKRRIADPIRMDADKWHWRDLGEVDGMIVCSGSGGISIAPLELARFGLLFLNKGCWQQRQLLSKEWVEESTTPQVDGSVPPVEPDGWYVKLPGSYGLNWWVNGKGYDGKPRWPSAPPKTYAAQGNRNNYCFIIPEWDTVFVRMGTDKAIDSALYDGFFVRLRAAFTDGTSHLR